MNMLSIITCTYNPHLLFLERLLSSVAAAVEYCGIPVEYVIVDNNSNPAISQYECVRCFLAEHPWARIMLEKSPGLYMARCAGIRASVGEWIVFFDDDNEPTPDYLNALAMISYEKDDLGCLGAGCIDVEFPANTSCTVRNQAKAFQQREMSGSEFYSRWDECTYFPYGTGLCVKREVALSYEEKVVSTDYTMSDRTGRSLASGSDLQIVFEALRLKMQVGASPSLKIKHLIEPRKARFRYLMRLRFGCDVSYHPALRQVFPEARPDLVPGRNRDILRFAWWHLVLLAKGRLTVADFVLRCIERLAQIESQVLAYEGLRRPLVASIMLFLLRLA